MKVKAWFYALLMFVFWIVFVVTAMGLMMGSVHNPTLATALVIPSYLLTPWAAIQIKAIEEDKKVGLEDYSTALLMFTILMVICFGFVGLMVFLMNVV
jgi:hypothetical protein